LKAKKSYGQHFLHQKSIAERIAHSLTGFGGYKSVIEVGPGKGVLSQFLFDMPYDLTMIDADPDMVTYMQSHFPNVQDQVILSDFLRIDLNKHAEGQQVAIVGNFPYNISSQILIKGLENYTVVPEIVGMFQKEVAVRVTIGPGSKEYGVLGVLMQSRFETEYLFSVDKSCFSPPPKVQSGVIRLKRKDIKEFPCDEILFRKIVKATFNQRRKMLRNTIKPFISSPEELSDSFFDLRPEQISLEDFYALTRKVSDFQNNHNS
jgi:16S rRNA (adenine1518-N6/adenine1519-N6)-dimethyltransferase